MNGVQAKWFETPYLRFFSDFLELTLFHVDSQLVRLWCEIYRTWALALQVFIEVPRKKCEWPKLSFNVSLWIIFCIYFFMHWRWKMFSTCCIYRFNENYQRNKLHVKRRHILCLSHARAYRPVFNQKKIERYRITNASDLLLDGICLWFKPWSYVP